MANRERPGEKDAAQFVSEQTGQQFVHADINGGVDYLSKIAHLAALEVTTITGEHARSSAATSAHLHQGLNVCPGLNWCWIVTVDADHTTYKSLAEFLSVRLSELELVDISSFNYNDASIAIFERQSVANEMAELARAGVLQASVVPCDSQGHVAGEHGFWLSSAGGGTSGGSDESLTLIEIELNSRPDNFKKLAESGAAQTHLFVWLDFYTDFSIARPLDRQGMAENYAHFGLPSRPPVLVGLVSDLWIVHKTSRRGWHWDGQKWNALEPTIP